MDDEQLGQFLRRIQDAFISGRLEEMRSYFSLPVVIYSLAGVAVLRTDAEFLTALQQYRAAIIALAVTSSTVEIVARDRPKNSRLRVTVRVTDQNAQGRTVATSLVRYFLIETDTSYRIEMLEYLESPLSADEVERIVH